MVKITPLPDEALLQTYAQRPDCYTDCFSSEASGNVTLQQFITAFYSTPLFGLERIILKLTVKRPSTAHDIAALADGTADTFAAWTVEAREADQILLCDMGGRTRSWLMAHAQGSGTKLYFGSAVTPPPGGTDLGLGFRALLGFHKVYSRALLWSAMRGI